LEEYDFFDEMCFIALDIGKEVKFAAVIDSNGKLITGKQSKYDDYYYINNNLTRASLLQSLFSSVTKDNIQNSLSISFCHYNTNYLFYANYLTAALKRIKNGTHRSNNDDAEQESACRVELVQVHGLLKIAITPLTASNDRYLCIYLQSTLSDQEVIAKISSVI
jgi:hypothetical protein